MSDRPTRPIAINGKFLSASPTGVHRVAAELITAVDALVAHDGGPNRWTVLKPRDARRSLQLNHIRERTVGLNVWQPWEQIDLPIYAQRELLVNLCNLGPLFHPASMVMMHDAQVFSSPESYSPKFRLWYQALQPLLGRRAMQILTVSEFSKQQLAHYHVAPESKITVVPNGCDHLTSLISDFAAVDRLPIEGRPFVLALANVQTHKNVGLLTRAFADPRMRDLRLVLVGKAAADDFEAAGLVLAPNVVFAGAVSDAGLKALYERALCLAFPSLTEGFGLPPLEGMSLGCPAVVAPCGALPEVCGTAAVYAPPNDPGAWVEAISELAADGTTRARMATAGRAQALGYTWAKSGQGLLSAIDRK